jgi:hypothetical protein
LLEFLGVSGGASECAALPLTLKSTAMGPSNQRVVQSLDELAATVRRHSGQNGWHVKNLRRLGEPDDVVHDHRRLAALQVGELEGLVIEQDQDRLLRVSRALGRTPPIEPTGLSEFDGIVLRSSRTGRLPHRVMRDAIGTELPAALNETIVVNDPGAVSQAALLSLGVALISVPEALPYLDSNALVRLVPSWYADLGPISLYYITRPVRCCRPKRASLLISSWRLFGGIAWPNASREVSDRTRPIVLASLMRLNATAMAI